MSVKCRECGFAEKPTKEMMSRLSCTKESFINCTFYAKERKNTEFLNFPDLERNCPAYQDNFIFIMKKIIKNEEEK